MARLARVALGTLLVGASAVAVIGADGLSPGGKADLLVTVAAVLLWILEPVDKGIASLLVLTLLIATGAAGNFGSAAAGFTSPALYFYAAVNLVAVGLSRAGIVEAATARVERQARGRMHRSLYAVLTLSIGLPLLMPSASAVTRLCIQLYSHLAEVWRLPAKHAFHRFSILQIASLSIPAALLFASGNSLNIFAYEFIRRAGLRLTWLQWTLAFAPTVLFLTFIPTVMGIRIWRVPDRLPPGAPVTETGSSTRRIPICQGALWVSATMLVGIIWSSVAGYPLELPVLMGVVAFAAPPLRLLRTADLDARDWEDFLTIGVALSLAHLTEVTGAAQWVIQRVTALAGSWLDHPSTALGVLILVTVLFRLLIVIPVTAFSLMSPMILIYARATGLATLPAILTVVTVMASVSLFPISSATCLMGARTSAYTQTDQLLMGLLLLVLAVLASYVNYFVFWPLLGLN